MKISIYNVKEEPLGRGGMGQVYYGTDPQGNAVAIKEMLAQFVTDSNLRARFHQDAEILSKLEHPFIVKLYGHFEERGNLYLAMEYIEGRTVEQYVAEKGELSEKRAIHLFLDILSALDYVHRKGYVHRDIKPSNIMIRSDGRVCIIDFGIAKDMNRTRSGSGLSSVVGMQIGTVGYMSPEQVEGLSIDHRTDIYSLGCLLFYMLTQHHAFPEQSNHFKTQMAIVQGSFPSAKLYNPALSDDIRRIIYKATNKDMMKRFQSCSEFEAALRNLISTDPFINHKEADISEQLDMMKNENKVLQEQLNNARETAQKLQKEKDDFSIELKKSEESKLPHKIAWIVLSIVCIIIFIGFASALGNKNSEISWLENKVRSAETKVSALQTKLLKIQEVLPFKIDKIEIGNESSSTVIDDYGSTLYASRMRYLTPKIYYTSFLENSKSFTIYYKIYQPNGSLKYNDEISTTYSGRGNTETIYTGSNSTTLSGWGNATTSVYSSGTYCIEIWCNDMCLKTMNFRIN